MEMIPLDIPSDEVTLINPTADDFADVIQGVSYTLHSFEGAKFPRAVGEIFATHLKDRIIGKVQGVITQEKIAEVLKDIYADN